MTDQVLIPILAEMPLTAASPTQFYQALGGLAQTSGNPDPIFMLGYRIIDRQESGETVVTQGAATEDMLDIFPEFEDLYALAGSWGSGVPVNVYARAVVVMGLTGKEPFEPARAAALFRVQPPEVNDLFCEIIKAIAESEAPGLTAGLDVLSAWITKQENRWAGEAASVVEAHDLEPFAYVPSSHIAG
ncbi:hypothetical protein HOU02_gp458 [Caulobacter phage CcrBL9]|uniref:Uncharacterized protein n=1 Tax=Caulobacter phage CcrBL9 TaxID=2283270 RepID=A0A385EEN0_9CAUD|nr:hypothetical protein HOU02_gp458 [Caulobacter phage CcrBL9]AXQ69267.1 hypothetical protein CcrBL9_gp243c [Caulobacter phage CcrBL9]